MRELWRTFSVMEEREWGTFCGGEVEVEVADPSGMFFSGDVTWGTFFSGDVTFFKECSL